MSTLAALQQQNPYARVEVVNRLRVLKGDVSELDVHADEARDQLVLRAKVPGVDNWLYGRSLSDGTLRYVALAMMLVYTRDRGVLCFEEPENGIHPSRIPSLVTKDGALNGSSGPGARQARQPARRRRARADRRR